MPNVYGVKCISGCATCIKKIKFCYTKIPLYEHNEKAEDSTMKYKIIKCCAIT